jgi:membrane-bound ClpP family serine protease
MRRMAMSVLVFEAFIALFFGLAVAKLHPAESSGWIAAVVLGGACVVLAGMTRRRWSIAAGWVLQLGFLAAGFIVADMFILGAIFTALWWAGLHYGAKAEQIKAQRVAAYEDGQQVTLPTQSAQSAQSTAQQAQHQQ